MSLPACLTCKHFDPCMLPTDPPAGDCRDSTKIIHSIYGAPSNEEQPHIRDASALTCTRHTPVEQ